MPAPSVPGIYIATLLSDELVPVTRDRRYVDTCARVNILNIKVGKARDLAVRERNYQEDFKENVVFLSVAKTTTEDIRSAETAIFRKPKAHRKASPKGGRMDWLEGITRERVIEAIYEALADEGICFERLYPPQAG